MFSKRLFLWVLLLGLLAGCVAPRRAQGQIRVTVQADGQSHQVRLPAGSTVQQALQAAGVKLGALDRTEPPAYALLDDGATVQVVRVSEKFTVRQEIVPFERQTLRNEALPEGETRLLQAGANGRRDVTYREVYENGHLVSNQAVKSVVVETPVPEIVMIGVQTPFVPREIPGRLAYLAAGNAWVMDGNTGERRPVVTSGDLDGRVFSLSPNGRFLLFTRKAPEKTSDLNTLWLADLNAKPAKLVSLGVKNIAHFADFAPYNPYTIAYSTVEPRPQPPGWQANNDLYTLSFSTSGWEGEPLLRLEPNAGGVYGWWGTTFAWAPVGTRLAFARPDGVGLFEFDTEEGLQRLLPIVPYQTHGDWAWTPPLGWGPDGRVLFTVSHGDKEADETSPVFDLTALVLGNPHPIRLVANVGMFANPAPSPRLADGGYRVAFLQAVFPQKSEISRYRLWVMDRDGSNRRQIFPPEGGLGLMPQHVVWSPAAVDGHFLLAVIYQGNLYLVNADNGKFQQLTGDGLITRLAWR